MVWRADLPEGNESSKVKYRIVPFTRGRGLDLGCGPWKVWPHAIGVDNFAEWDPSLVGPWRPDVTCDVTDLAPFADKTMDYVFSSHVLEHIDDAKAVLREWWRVIKPGGYLVLYLPHALFYPNMGEKGSNPDHRHDFLPDDVEALMFGMAYDLVVREERGGGDEYSFLMVFQKLSGSRKRRSFEETRATGPRALVIRYGGIGDILQASSVLPALKEQGFHITFNTTPSGQNLLRHDPHIDDWWIQDKDQVPNQELGAYWESLGREFDRIVNLSESVEGTLLAIPGRRTHSMSKAARHALLDVNYFDFVHALADVPPGPRQKFYLSEQERQKVKALRARIGGAPLIVWALAGSSVHKVWPWLDVAVDSILHRTDAHILFVGDQGCAALEHGVLQSLAMKYVGLGYDKSHKMDMQEILRRLSEGRTIGCRLHLSSGVMPIRDALAHACMADIVIGPETGILNGVAFEPEVRKIVMLSHSSPKNLTRDWKNAFVVAPTATPCYPCHRLHYTRDFCPEDPNTGASICAAAIEPELIVSVVTSEMQLLRKAG